VSYIFCEGDSHTVSYGPIQKVDKIKYYTQPILLWSLAELEAFHFFLYDKNEMLAIVYSDLK
jgi:hypothetical protein